MKAVEILLSVALLIALVWMFPAKQIPMRAAECEPNDQDQYTYSPQRFLILSPCFYVTGIVRGGAFSLIDGDGFVDLELDEPYRFTLNGANEANTRGWLHLETVCFMDPEPGMPPYFACKNDLTAYRGKLPRDGAHIWAEGRWVWDLYHGGHAELHPLYRWGELD